MCMKKEYPKLKKKLKYLSSFLSDQVKLISIFLLLLDDVNVYCTVSGGFLNKVIRAILTF